MQTTNTSSTAGQFDLVTRPRFNVVLAYDEFAGGLRAKEFFDGLVRDHGEWFEFNCHVWKFELLQEPHLFKAAARDASGADLIVLAIRESQGLGVEVRRCVEHWLPSKQDGSSALVVLLGGQHGQAGSTTSVSATLRQLAEAANMQFLCKKVDWPAMDSHLALTIAQPQRRDEPRHSAPVPVHLPAGQRGLQQIETSTSNENQNQ